MKFLQTLFLLVILGHASVGAPDAMAQNTGFTYQGHLENTEGPATGSFDFKFSMFEQPLDGRAVASITNASVAVDHGLFTAILHFDPVLFDGRDYWLQVAVRPEGEGDFTNLNPRQPLTRIAYAVQADRAAGLSGPLEHLEVDGSLILGFSTNAVPGPGTIRWTGRDFQGFNGVEWVSLTGMPLTNNVPTAANDEYVTEQGTVLNVSAPGVLANDIDADDDPLTALLVGETTNGSLSLNPDGSFSYTPNPDFNGVDTYSYRVSDGEALSALAMVSILVGPNDPPLMDRLVVSTIPVPAGVKPGVSNWRIWGLSSLNVAPVFTVPLANCGTLIGYTTGGADSPVAQVAYLNAADQLVTNLSLGDLECRGLAAEPDGHFAALLWDDATDTIFAKRYSLSGAHVWTTELVSTGSFPDDFGIGDSRFEYGDGTYGAYYHVNTELGNDSETLKWLDAVTGLATTGRNLGCSHSMSALLRYSAGAGRFLPACVTDCFPGTSGDLVANSIGGIYLDFGAGKIMDVDAACNGKVAGELGGAAPAPAGWQVVFNAHQTPATTGQTSYDPSTENQDIGFSTVAANLDSSPVTWLTSTPTLNEADSTIARWSPLGESTEQYVVGWAEPGSTYAYKLARITATGSILEGPVDATMRVQWGRRDDPFRVHVNGDIIWGWFNGPGDTSLHVARLRSLRNPACAAY